MFFSKKQRTNPDFLKQVRERRVAEGKMKNLHMKFTKKASLWGEFSSFHKSDEGSKWYFDYMIKKLIEDKERAVWEKRR